MTMKKTLKYWMLLVTLSIVSCTANDDNPVENNDNPDPAAYATLEEALAANDLFSAIRENPDSSTMRKKENGELDYLSQYGMLFRQAVNHNQPDGDTFQQRVYILFRGFDRPTILVTEGYFWMAFGDSEDLGKNLNANMDTWSTAISAGLSIRIKGNGSMKRALRYRPTCMPSIRR